MNKVVLMGRLTKDPEIRYSQSAEPLAITRFTLAVNKRTKKEGEPDADFINCTTFGKNAEFVGKYFKKGMMMTTCGRISVRSYDDPQSGQKRWITEVITDEHDFAESKSAFESRNTGASNAYPSYQNSPQPPSYDAAPSKSYAPYEPVPSTANAAPYDSTPDKAYLANDFSPIAESADDEDLPF